MRVYLNPEGRGLSCFEEEFRRIGRSGYLVLEAERKKKKGGIAVNLTGTTFICFSHFFYAFLCLCCLRTRVRTLGTVCVGSQSFGVRFVLRLFFWISDSLRKVLKNFETLSQPAQLVGKPDQPIH